MAVREFKKRWYRERRQQSRRDLIARTARIWTKLYREATTNLKAITGNWLKKFLKQAQQEIASGYVSDIQELPPKFTQTLERILRQALAQGYWLNHVYVQELRHARQGTKYHGRINLSDKDEEEKLIEALEKFMNAEISDEWNEVIPESAVNWLKDYVPKLAGVLSVDVLEKTREVIRGSMMTGSTLQERMKALRESSETLQRMTDARIETIARTEITRADSMGRLIEMKGNDDVIGVEFSAVMDDRTTEMCAERHGLVMRLDDPRLPENTPPLHFRCRSLLLSLTVYDYPDGLLTSHEFDEVHSGIQRESDIEEVRALLGGFESAVEETISVIETQPSYEEIIQQDADYRRQRDDILEQLDAAILRGDATEHGRLIRIKDDLDNLIYDLSSQVREAKIEMAERGVVYASGISRKLSSSDVKEIIHEVEGASAPIRRVWNLLEGRMKIADTNESNAHYSPRYGTVHFDILSDKYSSGDRPRYGVLFHELGHLIDDKSGKFGIGISGTAELRNSLISEADSYITSTLTRLKREALASGKSPKGIKKADAYAAVEKELLGQLSFKEKCAVSDVFSGVTLNKVKDGWTHSTSYWKENERHVCYEFFAQTFSDSINNPEAIETTKKYFPESYKIFERIIREIGDKK